jgi:hypothetical protein
MIIVKQTGSKPHVLFFNHLDNFYFQNFSNLQRQRSKMYTEENIIPQVSMAITSCMVCV